MLCICILLLFIIILEIIYWIVSGYTVGLIIILILILIVYRLTYIRINDVLISYRFCHKINQKASLKWLLEIWFKNNFESLKRTKNFEKILVKNKIKARKFFSETNIKKFKTTTNNEIIDILSGFERKGIISIIDKGNLKIKKQQLEKLLLYGAVTIIKNIRNKNFWNFINKTENIKKYEIIVNKNNKKN